MTTDSFYILAGSDDAEEAYGKPYKCTISGVSIRIGSSARANGLRFTDHDGLMATMVGGTISDARVVFKNYQYQVGALTVRFYVQMAATPATFAATNANITNRTVSAAYVDWVIPDWTTIDGEYTSPNLAALLQELIGTYTPTHIAVIIRLMSAGGTGTPQRRYDAYDLGVTGQPARLDVTWTAAIPTLPLSPPVVIAKGTAPVPTVSPGERSFTAPITAARTAAPVPTLAPGGVSLSPPIVSAKATALDSSLTAGPITISPPTAQAKAIAADAELTTSGEFPQTFTPPLAVAKATAAAPTLSPSAVSVEAPVASAAATASVPILSAGPVTLAAPLAAAVATSPRPQLFPGLVTVAAPLATARSIASLPSLTIAGVANYTHYRMKRLMINTAQYPVATRFQFVSWLRTTDAGKPCQAYLHNDTLGEEVVGSRITSVATTKAQRTVSDVLTLTGNHAYSVWYGGAAGAAYTCTGAMVRAASG